MRQLHPKTIWIASWRDDIPKTVISHCWAEVFKHVKTQQKHPKCFIDDEHYLGVYLRYVYDMGIKKGCNLDRDKVKTLPARIQTGFETTDIPFDSMMAEYFDDIYLFSDACSLYFKGINIFPDIYGDKWRKYIPVESRMEIKRQIDKTLKL